MESIWSQSCQIPRREALSGDVGTEIAVIGAGMAGVLIAHTLQEAGHRVLVLEARRIGGGQTRNTTAKLTSQHGLIYRKLLRTLGEDRARAYGMAQEKALRAYRELIAAHGIDCDFQECSAYVYGGDVAALRAEAEAARRLGLPAAFTDRVSLPFPAAGAVRFTGQAQFHPLKLLKALSASLTVYEDTPVLRAEGRRLVTPRGSVEAEKVVFACHYPFPLWPGLYFARLHQERSYVLALEGAEGPGDMWIGAGEGGYSLRRHGELLLLGGGGHRCGADSAGGGYAALRRAALTWFPESREVAHWSAQDGVTPDHVPYIGRYAASRPHWYVAAGFQKWGMSSSMAAALLLRELIEGRESPYAAVFDPGRLPLAALPGLAAQSGQAVKGLTRRFFQIPSLQAKRLPPGKGGVALLRGEKRGAYREENGGLHTVELRCPHMGCQLEWNAQEESWDCPCHGSRFDAHGALLSGPAQRDLPHRTWGR